LGEAQGRTLEIGCGWGYNFTHYPATATVTAFDVKPDRLAYAAQQGAPSPLAQADGERLPWPDRTFEAVVGTLVFCSIPNPAAALAEARRVLQPGGRLLLVEHVRSHQAWLGTLQDWLAPAWKWGTGGCNLNRPTEATVRAAGFEIERHSVGWGGLLKLMVAKSRMV
jgi:ubiquinone/menaquinone biosynthesis C-methylase UbiE